jgi:hypothetical protein
VVAPSARFSSEWLPVADLADDGDVGRHSQESGHETAEIHV